MSEPLLKFFGDKGGQRQSSLERATRTSASGIADGRVVSVTVTEDEPIRVAHGLGRTPVGAIIIAQNIASVSVTATDASTREVQGDITWMQSPDAATFDILCTRGGFLTFWVF